MPAETRTLNLPDVDLVYDVIEPDAPADPAKPTLLLAGHPMTGEGFLALAGHFTDRRVALYDPRGLGRSVRKDGSSDRSPALHVADLHALITEIGGPVDILASSGGAVNALALVEAHPDDVRVLVAHEPPLIAELPDAEAAFAAEQANFERYQQRGFGAGMAGFIGLVSWQGEFTPAYFEQPEPDPAAFGLPVDDDGSRDDPLLSGTAKGVTAYRASAEKLARASGKVFIGVGVETGEALPARTARAAARAFDLPLVEFPSHHGGFGAEEGPYPGKATEFAVTLRRVLDQA